MFKRGRSIDVAAIGCRARPARAPNARLPRTRIQQNSRYDAEAIAPPFEKKFDLSAC